MIPALAHFPIDPAYGTGAYRRRLRFESGTTGVTALVDDAYHSYWLSLDHDGAHITAIDAGFNRAPTDMCPGSTAGLRALVGFALATPTSALLAELPRQSNCTHLVDLAVWSIAHVHRSATWEIVVPDQIELPVRTTIERDGRTVHDWSIANFQMVAPGSLAGNPLMAGFMQWAMKTWSGEVLLAATMLQRGLFVARGRQHVVDRGDPMPLASAPGMAGMCWSYSADRLHAGTGTLGYVRDFSDAISPDAPPPHVLQRLKDLQS